MTQPLILAFDSSGPHCAVALIQGETVLASHFEEMAKGQAEALMPLIEATLSEADTTLADLAAIGVGIGPGNFTGIRISVSAARGLALALGIPAIGVSSFDAGYGGRRKDISALVVLPAPRDAIFVQQVAPENRTPRMILGPDELATLDIPPLDLIVAPNLDALPDWFDLHCNARSVFPPIALAIARVAASRLGTPQPRPAPLYIKPADAAPSREAGPIIL